MWRAFLFDEPELARYIEIGRQHGARLVRDAARLLDELLGGRNELGTIADVRAWLAGFRALDLDPRRADQRRAEAAARARADVERRAVYDAELDRTPPAAWSELAWRWIDDGVAHRALLARLDQTHGVNSIQIAAIDALRDADDDDRPAHVLRIAEVLSPELEAVLVGSLVRDDQLDGVLVVPDEDDDDDEDGGEDDEDGEDGEDGEADGEDAEANGESREALDDEEQAWHRVWADEPVARPATAAPVRLSFVPSGGELIRRRRLAWAALPWIDKAVAEARDPSNAVAFGALLAPFLSDELRGGELNAAVQEVAHPLIVQLHVTRRDSERLRFLLIAQRKLYAAGKRGSHAELTGGREVIDDAVLLYELLERAAGNEPKAAPAITSEGGAVTDDDDDPNRPRKRRRRRRGGRRRRRDLFGR